MSALAAAAPPPAAEVPRVAQLGMWIFLGTELLFFGGLFVGYAYGRTHWPHGFAVASRHTDVVLGTINTALLLTSSAIVAFAVASAEAGEAHRRATARALWLTAALGVAFLAVKGVEYAHEWGEHLFPIAGFALAEPGAELFWVLYFVTTGLHALHLAIGIAGVAAFARATGARKAWPTPARVETMALYWHFVDVVWIVLWPLLYLVERHA